MKSKAELAKEFTINDVFLVNHAMVHAEEKYKEAWNRVRAKLLISAEIPTPAITITNLEVVSGSNPNKFNPELVEAVEEFIAARKEVLRIGIGLVIGWVLFDIIHHCI